jgi:hypothetical protein
MVDPKQTGPAAPAPVAVGRALLKGVRPGERVCSISGLAVYQGRRKDSYMAIIALEGRAQEHRDRFARVSKYGNLTGLRVEHVDESLVLASPLPSGTLADLSALGWRMARRLETFAAIAHLFKRVHAAGQVVGPLGPSHIFLDDGLAPFFLGPGIAEIHGDTKNIYCAPETAKEGRNDDVSDVFVLGRILHFLLIQKAPSVEGGTTPRLDELMQVPAGLSRIVRKCCTADRTKRYQNIDALLGDFARYSEHDMVGMAHAEVREQNLGRESRPPARAGAASVTAPRLNQTNPRMQAPGSVRREQTNPRISQMKLPAPPPPAEPKPGLFEMKGLTRVALGFVGVVLVGAAAAISFYSGYQPVSLGLLGAGAFLFAFSLVPGGFRGESPLRVIFGVALAAPLLWWNPLPELAVRGATERLLSASHAVRAVAFQQLLTTGQKKFPAIDLSGADLRGLRCMKCDLSDFSLEGANLEGALFVDTALSATKFARSNLAGAKFERTSTNAARGFSQALCDEATQLPADWVCAEGHPDRVTEIIDAPAPTEGAAPEPTPVPEPTKPDGTQPAGTTAAAAPARVAPAPRRAAPEPAVPSDNALAPEDNALAPAPDPAKAPGGAKKK